MGTAITLSVNGITVDERQHRDWVSHYWLFPPKSLMEIDYFYANNHTTRNLGFQTTLGEARSRLSHLGYSVAETRNRFELVVARWNRTSELPLPFDDFVGALEGIDLASMTYDDLKPHLWDFRAFIIAQLAQWDTEDASLEDFIFGLDLNITLKVLADRESNRPLPLRWHTHDFIDNGGWASLEDLTDLDRDSAMARHTILLGRLQDHTGKSSITDFDSWLHGTGIPRATRYTKLFHDGTTKVETKTLPYAVRNMIHHPENTHNSLSDDDLRNSIELLIQTSKNLPSPLPGTE